jgi:hypothetical protein
MRASANDPAGSLRTLDLRPRVLEASYADAVWSVCRFRESMLAGASGEGEDGRLLVYFPDAELSDGAAEKASKGFFDVYNCPPWDTFVAFHEAPASVSFGNTVVAWVPSALVAVADRGVSVNPEQCIQWLSASLARRLGLALPE